MDPPMTERRRTASRGEAEAGVSVEGHMAQMVWDAGSRQVREAFVSYGRIDLFRPYFDVEPKQVRNRLLQSLLPRKPSQMQVATDLYGPLMLVFTLVALLLFTMKNSGYTVQDGTLIGTSLLTAFGYWFLGSMCVYSMCYVFSCDVGMVHIYSMMGYALFGHCIVILLTTVFHPVHTHLFFYMLLFGFGGASWLRMAIYLASKTRDRSHKLILAASVFALHMGFLLYLHFGFHTVVQELEEMLGDGAPRRLSVGFGKSPTPAPISVDV